MEFFSSPFFIASVIAFSSLLVSYLRKPEDGFDLLVDPVFGKNQKYISKAGAGKTLLNEITEPHPDAEVKLMTYNFPKKEWGEGSAFFSWVSEQLGRGVKIKTLGGPEIEAIEDIKKLANKGLEVKILDSSETQHYVLITSPVQLWAEQKHHAEYAYDCYYTKEPSTKVWEEINAYYDGLYKRSKSFCRNN